MSTNTWIDKAKEVLSKNNEGNVPIMDKTKDENSKEKKIEKVNNIVHFSPNTDICTCNDELLMNIDMPGIDKNNLSLNYENEILSIEASIILDEYEGLSPIYTEYKVGNYERKFHIGEGYDLDRISASLDNGVLSIKLPKRETYKPRKIEIK